MAPAAEHNEVAHALRVAGAAALCLVLAEWWHLEQAALAVFTTHMVMAQYAVTAFQKGVERLAGRTLGIVGGLALLTLCQHTPLLAVFLKALALLTFFYVHFSGRLAYTFLNAGLYLAIIVEIGHADPTQAFPQGKEMFLAVLVGVAVATAVVWLTGAESDLHIEPGGQPLFPLQGDRVQHSAMLVIMVLLTQVLTRWQGQPASASMVSVMMLTIAPDMHALIRKGELRFAGALLGAVWGLGAFALLAHSPGFPLMVMLLFFGIFLAAYLTRVGGDYSYAGLQMGLVLPMVLVVPSSEFGTLAAVIARLEGIATGLVVSVVVGGLWASFGWGMPLEPGKQPV